MSEPTLFVPFTGKHGSAPVQRETRLIRDYTMPAVNPEKYQRPAYERIDARTICAERFAP